MYTRIKTKVLTGGHQTKTRILQKATLEYHSIFYMATITFTELFTLEQKNGDGQMILMLKKCQIS